MAKTPTNTELTIDLMRMTRDVTNRSSFDIKSIEKFVKSRQAGTYERLVSKVAFEFVLSCKYKFDFANDKEAVALINSNFKDVERYCYYYISAFSSLPHLEPFRSKKRKDFIEELKESCKMYDTSRL